MTLKDILFKYLIVSYDNCKFPTFMSQFPRSGKFYCQQNWGCDLKHLKYLDLVIGDCV